MSDAHIRFLFNSSLIISAPNADLLSAIHSYYIIVDIFVSFSLIFLYILVLRRSETLMRSYKHTHKHSNHINVNAYNMKTEAVHRPLVSHNAVFIFAVGMHRLSLSWFNIFFIFLFLSHFTLFLYSNESSKIKTNRNKNANSYNYIELA